jgi:Flp pilus assembly pilin Flp
MTTQIMRSNNHRLQGQGLVEYALIIAIIAVAGGIVLSVAGANLGDTFNNLNSALSGNNCPYDDDNCDTIEIAEADDTEENDRNNACDYSFSDASSLDDWVDHSRPIDTPAYVKDGKLMMDENGWYGPGHQMLNDCPKKLGHSDLQITFTDVVINRNAGDPSGSFSFIFRRQEQPHADGYWIFYLTFGNRDLVMMHKRVKNRMIGLGSRWISPSVYGIPFNLQVNAVGDQISVLRNGEQILQVTDDTFTDGGLRFHNGSENNLAIDHVTIRALN